MIHRMWTDDGNDGERKAGLLVLLVFWRGVGGRLVLWQVHMCRRQRGTAGARCCLGCFGLRWDRDRQREKKGDIN